MSDAALWVQFEGLKHFEKRVLQEVASIHSWSLRVSLQKNMPKLPALKRKYAEVKGTQT
jgi:hypothetical protein